MLSVSEKNKTSQSMELNNMKYIFLGSLLAYSCSSYAFDYVKHLDSNTKEESCKMYRQFNLNECKKQAKTARDSTKRPNCEMWKRQRERAILDCDGKSEKAKMEKKQKQTRQNLRKNATHVLVQKGRLVCRSERSFRDTYNYIVAKKPGTPPHLLSKVCNVLQYETIVKIDKKSDDNKVSEITYMSNYGAIRYGFTASIWLVTKQRYNEIVKERKKGLM